MVLQNGEYEIKGDSISIPKAVLEEWREHYNKVADDRPEVGVMHWFYLGKAEVLTDLLKMFDPLEV